MNTIRLSLTPEIRQVLDTIRTKYPPLSDPEILKVALSDLYMRITKPKPLSRIDVDELTTDGRRYFETWLKERKKDINTVTEDEVYDLIKHA